MGKFIVKLDQKTCDCEKPQKLHVVVCKHINIDYLQYVHLVYTLDYVSSVYKVPLADMRHHDYWPYEGPKSYVNLAMRRNKKGQPKSTRIQINMDDRERDQQKYCSICRLVDHSKNSCLHRSKSFSQTI